MVEILSFIFLDFWHFLGFLFILAIICSFIETIVNSFLEMIPKLIHGNHDNFYISEKNIDEEFLKELKKYSKSKNEK